MTRCAALDWDKTRKDYVECDPKETAKPYRILGIVAVEVELCATHRRVFEEELSIFGGHLDKKKRIIELKG